MKYKCIIFDCDGVLVDSETIAAKVLVEMAMDVGAEFNMPFEDVVMRFSGVSLKYTLDYIQSQLGCPLPESFEKDFRKRTYQEFKEHLKPVEGVYDLINNLSCDFCVASSGPQEKIKLNLELAGLYQKFEGHIFSSYDINSWKPDPGIYLYAAKKMGFAPNECAVIEDSVSGVIAAREGGFDVYGFANSHNESKLREEGAYVFHSMRNLFLLLSYT